MPPLSALKCKMLSRSLPTGLVKPKKASLGAARAATVKVRLGFKLEILVFAAIIAGGSRRWRRRWSRSKRSRRGRSCSWSSVLWFVCLRYNLSRELWLPMASYPVSWLLWQAQTKLFEACDPLLLAAPVPPSLLAALSWQVSWWTARGCRQCGLFRCFDGRPQIRVAAAIDFDSISLPYSSRKIWPTVSDPCLPDRVKLHFPGPFPDTAA